MRLRNVYDVAGHATILYSLLTERTAEQSISHKTMPSFGEHVAFLESHPYAAWYLIDVDGEFVGSIYLSNQREIGIFVFARFQGKGYGKKAIELLIAAHPGKVLANCNPSNLRSKMLFSDLGFKLLQETYVLE